MRLLNQSEAEHYKAVIDQYIPSPETLEIFTRSRFAVIAGPTGAGKDTIRNALLSSSESFIKILSTTSRPLRPGEADGVDYHFRDLDFFDQGFREKRFFQAALVHNQQISCLDIADIQTLSKDQIGLSILIVQTELQLRLLHPNLQTIFLVPTNLQTLMNRMQAGRSLEQAEMQRRLDAAKVELQIAREQSGYYCIVNQDIATVELQAQRYLINGTFDQAVDDKARATIDLVLQEMESPDVIGLNHA